MTVTANTTRNDYTAGSAQSVYNYTFQLNEAADVDVYLDGVKQTLNTHYTVQNIGNASGGTITFTLVDANNNPIHPTQGAIINIVMAMDLDRDTNYQPSGAFLATDVNNDFDRLWLATNQQQTAVNRALRLKDTDVTTSSMELPLKDDRKGKLLGFNASTGDPEVTTNNQTNWDSAYNDTITSASFSGSTLTLGQRDGNTIIATHTPYLPIAGGTLTGDLALGANKLVFPSLEIYGVVGDHSIIKETGSGNLFIQGTDVRIQSANADDIIKGVADGAVTLYYDNNPKLATTNTGISVTGTLSATGYNDANWNTAYNDKINAVNYSSSNNTLTLTQQDGSTLTTIINGGGGGGGETLAQTLAIGNTTGGNDIKFADDNKALFGAGNDLKIYHSANNESYIHEVGSGNLNILATTLKLQDANGVTKAEVKSTGIDVTGDIEQSTGDLKYTGGINWDIAHHGAGQNIVFSTTPAGGSATQRMRIDSSGNVGIGTSSPNVNADLHIADTSDTRIWVEATSGDTAELYAGTGVSLFNRSNSFLNFGTNNTERMRIDSSGNVIVGGSTAQQTSAVTLTQGGSIINDGFIKPATDASYDIGSSSQRYKDLYLSGNVFTDEGFYGNRVWNEDNSDLRFATNNTEQMRITSTGNVGIGTGSNTVERKVHIQGSGGTIAAKIEATDGNQSSLDLKNNEGEFRIINDGGELSVFDQTDNTERLRIDTTGKVGIGTTNPAEKLEVQGRVTVNNSYGYRIGGTSTGDAHVGDLTNTTGVLTLRTEGSRNLRFDTNGSERMRITNYGDIGIGTINPSADLHIYRGASGVTPATDSGLFIEGQSSCTLQLAAYWAGVTNINFGVGPYSSAQDPDNGQIYYSNYSKVMGFRVNGSERARLNFYGQLLVGTTGSQDTTSKLLVSGTSAATIFKASSGGSIFYGAGVQGSAGLDIRSYTTTSSFAQSLMRFSNSSNSTGGSITITGATVSYNTSSDERLKENIKDAEDAGDKIDAIKIRQFDWKDGGQHQDYGVIAQELDEVAPEAITKGATEDDMMSVDYSKLVPTLIKEIQSLRNRVAELEKN